MPSIARRAWQTLAAAARDLFAAAGRDEPRRRSLEERWNERHRGARGRARVSVRGAGLLRWLRTLASKLRETFRTLARGARSHTALSSRRTATSRDSRQRKESERAIAPRRCSFCHAVREAMGHTVRGSARRGRILLGAPRVLARWLASALVFRPEPRHHAAQTRMLRRRAYPGSRRRRYEIHRPQGYMDRGALPLVMLLHGCRQTSADIRAISRLDALADREQFVAVYPHVTGYSDIRMENCWGWWREEDIRAGAGEVEDLAQIVAEIRDEFAVDPRRIHVAGLSSGGAMALAALVAHPGLFASGAAIAGLPYSESPRAVGAVNGGRPRFKGVDEITSAMDGAMREAKREIPLLVVHSHDDSLVDIQAARNIRDSWRRCFGLDTPPSTRRGRTRGTAWMRERYRGRSRRTVVEALFLEGPGHGWYGGAPGEFSYPDAPDVSRLMWAFFRAHPRERRAAATGVGITRCSPIRISSMDART